MTYLFVYGTLMREQSNHGLIASFVRDTSDAWVDGMALHQPHPDYPCMFRGSGIVHGELIRLASNTEFEALRVLDQLEDYHGEGDPSNEYDRVRILVHPTQVEAWTYVWARPATHLSRIDSGDWRRESK